MRTGSCRITFSLSDWPREPGKPAAEPWHFGAADRHHETSDNGRYAEAFMREKYHLIYIVNEAGRIQAILPEQQLVSGYLDGKPGSAVSDLFM